MGVNIPRGKYLKPCQKWDLVARTNRWRCIKKSDTETLPEPEVIEDDNNGQDFPNDVLICPVVDCKTGLTVPDSVTSELQTKCENKPDDKGNVKIFHMVLYMLTNKLII